MSKKESEQQPKVSRKELRRQEHLKAQQSKNRSLIIVGTVILVALVALILYRVFEPEVEGVVFVDNPAISNQHDNSLVYELTALPPTGGVHNSSWQNCGIYENPVAAEYAVHSMEHGAVWITYRSDLSADEINQLQGMVRGESYSLLSPYPTQENKIVLTVWDAQLALDSLDDPRLEQFIERYKQARAPERGAPCNDGVGTPLG